MTENRPVLLLVEDQVPIRRLVRLLLAKYPIEIVEAGTVADAAARFAETRPRMVFLDVMLPDGDGVSLCRRFKSENAGVYVVMLSARGQQSDRERGYEAGCDSYVVKPFEAKDLIVELRKGLPDVDLGS